MVYVHKKIWAICALNIQKNMQSSFKDVSVCSTGIHRNSLVTASQLWLQGAMMSIAFKEGLKIPPPAMQEIILAANQDIRQVSTHSASVTIQIAHYVH